MNKVHSLRAAVPASLAGAVEALLFQDTCVGNGTTGSTPPPNAFNYGGGTTLRWFAR